MRHGFIDFQKYIKRVFLVSCSGTPLENLSKYISGVLKQYIKKRGHAKNSKEFSEFIHDIEVEYDEVMISFDVT